MGGGDTEMLYASFWQANYEKYPVHECAVICAKMVEKGVYPPPGVEIIGQWLSTGGRGVTIFKAKDQVAALNEYYVWELEKPGFFKHQETIVIDNLADGVGRTLAYKKVL